jgi:very-short-patch-repair endonuclease
MNKLDTSIIKMYNEENKSTYEIAEALGTYPNKIRRTLKKHGYELKDKRLAQQNALKSGRSPHPTMGKTRSLEEKIKISGGLVDYWEGMSDEEREERSEQAKTRWKEMSNEQKENMRAKGIEAIQKSAKEGSKLERFLLERLNGLGYEVKFHQMLIPAEKLEIDLYIPKLKTIIEVDGPSHFLPIWGEERLQKQMNADLRKSGTLLSRGYVVVRVKTVGFESIKRKEDIIEQIAFHLANIEEKFPKRSKRFIEVE